LTFAEATQEPTPENDVTETPVGGELPEVTPTSEETSVDTSPEAEVESMMGTITIEIVSVSGDPLPSDFEVELYGFMNMSQVYSATLTVSSDGFAVAENVPMITEQVIFATTDHDGVVYGSNMAVVESEMDSMTLTIPYYQTTTDLSVLQAERLHIFFELKAEETIQVFVLYIFSNSSDKVLAAEDPDEPILVFSLPEGAFNLQRDTGMELRDIELDHGFGLLTVYPSTEQYQILYSFEMPYENNKVDFDLPIGLDTSAVIVMIPEGGLEVKSDRLMDAGMRDIEGISYNLYNGSNLQAEDFLEMEVSGKPKAPIVSGEIATSVGTSSGLVIGLTVFGVVLIGSGVYLWVRNRSEENHLEFGEEDPASEFSELKNPDDLMDAIITLDDIYQTGGIPEDAYLKRRADLKAMLRESLGK
jgi:hypothetical protein